MKTFCPNSLISNNNKQTKKNMNISFRESKPLQYTNHFLTKFERCKIITTRVSQIENNAPIMLHLKNVESMSSIEIAKKELEARVIPLTVLRSLPNGSVETVDIRHILL